MTDAEVFTVGVKPSCTANTAVSHHVIQRSWALMKDFSPLSSVPLTSTQIEEIPPNGRCGWLALGRDRCEGELDYRDLSNLEKSGREVKLEILQGIMTWLGLGDLHDERTSRELTKDEVEGLCSVDVSLGRLPHTSASVRQLLHKMKQPNVWMSLPFCAFASDILGATITVWEPSVMGRMFVCTRTGIQAVFFLYPAQQTNRYTCFTLEVHVRMEKDFSCEIHAFLNKSGLLRRSERVTTSTAYISGPAK